MPEQINDTTKTNELLSALTDGAAHPDEVGEVCASWRTSAETRAVWHSYQVIGDVMRSEDLAQSCSGADFLKRFQARLADEPVVLAPQVAEQVRVAQPGSVAAALPLRKRAWVGPMAVAASFVMVVGAVVVVQTQQVGSGATSDVAAVVPAKAPAVRAGVATSVLAQSVMPTAVGSPGLMTVADAVESAQAVNQPSEPTFNRPVQASVILIHDPQLDQILGIRRGAGRDSEVFSAPSQSVVTRQVVFGSP
ncbi:MAG: sigma-E factor negative regulatory protein [Aquabacterium sp.]|uniref:sigma-E factor negative regulatory protein n=1 Tax=Aquabacterium sp. TaxID=1872578 RepID=UPI003BC2BE92